MYDKKKQAISLNVTEGLQVTILPSNDHEFLMSTNQVALGYGTSDYVIRKAKERNCLELLSDKHFLPAGTICHSDPHNKVYWTKRGVVRLGFFIKSKQAKLFRDWAEDLILNKIEQKAKIVVLSPIDDLEHVLLGLKNEKERFAAFKAFKEIKKELDVYKHSNRIYLLSEKGRILKKKERNRTQQERVLLNRAKMLVNTAEG